MKAMIDPGHSGPVEPGACAAELREADINLAVARFLRAEMKLRGWDAELTRNGPVGDEELDWRCDKANKEESDVFLSIHCNSCGNTDAEGTETCYFPGSTKGLALAEMVQHYLVDALLTEDRGVKEKNFYVLRYTECPAILVELAFLSNAVDRQMLTDPLEQWRAAAAIATGVEKYFLSESFTAKSLVVE
jgi:N-acetylmuramoyl-L-alanine amidase